MTIIKEITLLELKDNGKRYEVTLRIPEYNISETKLFNTLEDAKVQVNLWY